MENSIIKKRLNTFKSSKGTLRNVSDEVVMEVLRAWEQWPGTSAGLYRELGLSKMQMVTMIQKAKRLVKSGTITESEFQEVQVAANDQTVSQCVGNIELEWHDNKSIRFSDVDQLVDFLKKVA